MAFTEASLGQAIMARLAFAALQAQTFGNETTLPQSWNVMADVTTGGLSTSQRRAALAEGRVAFGEGMDHAPPPRDNAVRDAGRNTARVRFLRRTMVAGSALAVSVISIVAIFDPFHHLPHGISVGSVGVDGSVVTMESPKISGVRQDGGAYAITACQGIQDITKPGIMDLRGVDATLGMIDKTVSRITADTGHYDSKIDTMILAGNTRIKNTGGYDLRMQSAEMNFKTGIFSSRERLTVDISGGSISADKLDITDSGHKISFAGDVTSTFEPADDPGDAVPSQTPVDVQ